MNKIPKHTIRKTIIGEHEGDVLVFDVVIVQPYFPQHIQDVENIIKDIPDLLEALENCVRSMEALPYPNPFLGTSTLENAKEFISKHKGE